MTPLHGGNRPLELGEFGGLVFFHSGAFDAGDAEVRRQGEIGMAPQGAAAPALEKVGEGSLPAVEVDRYNALAGLQQRNGDVYRDRGFSRTALLVSDHDHVRRGQPLMYWRWKNQLWC